MSKATYERLRAYCETNGISMSQFVERRVGDYLGRGVPLPALSSSEAPASAPARPVSQPAPLRPEPVAAVPPKPAPAPRRIAPADDEPLAKDPDAKLTADQIFTF